MDSGRSALRDCVWSRIFFFFFVLHGAYIKNIAPSGFFFLLLHSLLPSRLTLTTSTLHTLSPTYRPFLHITFLPANENVQQQDSWKRLKKDYLQEEASKSGSRRWHKLLSSFLARWLKSRIPRKLGQRGQRLRKQ